MAIESANSVCNVRALIGGVCCVCVCVFWIRRWKEEHEWNESSLHQIAVRGAMAGQCNELQWTATKKNKLKIKHTTVSPAHLANRTKGSSISPMNSNDRETATATATEYVMAQLNDYLFIIQFRPFNCLTNMQWSSHRIAPHTHTHSQNGIRDHWHSFGLLAIILKRFRFMSYNCLFFVCSVVRSCCSNWWLSCVHERVQLENTYRFALIDICSSTIFRVQIKTMTCLTIHSQLEVIFCRLITWLRESRQFSTFRSSVALSAAHFRSFESFFSFIAFLGDWIISRLW